MILQDQLTSVCRIRRREGEPDSAGVDEVVRLPVGGADVAAPLRHHVLVVVHPGVGDLQMCAYFVKQELGKYKLRKSRTK